MTGRPALPLELWYTVCESLPFLDLWNVAHTCKVLHSCFSESLYARRDYLQQYYKVMNKFEMHNGHHRSHQGIGSPGQALELILCREMHPALIQSIRCGDRPSLTPLKDSIWASSIIEYDGGKTLRQALTASKWIYETEHESFFQLIAAVNEEAAFCVLLPMLSNLRDLHTDWSGKRAHEFVARIARSCDATVLPRLEVVSSASQDGERGVQLHQLAAYAALPSVSTMLAFSHEYDAVHDKFRRWPIEMPRSKASRVVINGNLSRGEIRKFGEGFRGPCNITQDCDEATINGTGRCFHLEIRTKIDPGTGDLLLNWRGVRLLENDQVPDSSIRGHKDLCDAHDVLLQTGVWEYIEAGT